MTAPAAGAQTSYFSRPDFRLAFTTPTTVVGPKSGVDPLDAYVISDPSGTTGDASGLDFGVTTARLFDVAPDPSFPDRLLQPAGMGSGQSWIVNNGGPTRITFGTAVRGFGATFFDAGSTGNLVFTFYFNGAQLGARALDGQVPGYDGFFGVDFGTFVDRVDIAAVVGDQYEMDDLVVGADAFAAVPEPAGVALVGAGLVAIGVTTRRRRFTLLTAEDGNA
jgi:hypothetical protein